VAVRTVGGLFEGGSVIGSAEDRHGQVLKRRPGPFPWVLQQIAGIHLALRDAVTDLRPRQLHDHVGGPGRESPEIHGLGRRDFGGWVPAHGAAADVDAAVSVCHARHTVETNSAGQNRTDPMPPVLFSIHNTPMARYGTASMAAVPIHSAIVISKLKTRRSVLSMSDYVNGNSDCQVLICDCLSEEIRWM
jgi:hypothetical protein